MGTPIGVITCGGSIYNETRKDKEERKQECVMLTNKNTWGYFPSMKKARSEFDMAVVGETLIAFGGYNVEDEFEKINWRNGEEWELIKMNRKFHHPCVTKWDEENILLIGGDRDLVSNVKNHLTVTDETWILNIANNKIKPGPSLNNARRGHGCTRIGNKSIIVAGGWRDYAGALKSTEMLEIGDLEWTNGPDLKEAVDRNEVVKSNRK